MGHVAVLVLFGFAESRIDIRMSFNIGTFVMLTRCRRRHSGSDFSNIFCTLTLVFSLDISRMKFPNDFFVLLAWRAN
jgi:hypothetical protein